MQRRPFRILHVEDDDAHARLVRRSFASDEEAVAIDRARDGAEAMAFVEALSNASKRRRPDLILLDLKLPKIDGQSILVTVKENPSLRAIPVVVLTTSDRESDRRRAYAAHANSYLVKPVTFDEFRSLVAHIKAYWSGFNRPVST